MRKFTLSVEALCSALVMWFLAVPVSAQISGPSDLFGTYEFTADVEITEAGQEYADLFSGNCEVVIESHSVYDFSIKGIGGSFDYQGGNLKSDGIRIMKPNGAGYYLWGKPVLWANADAERLDTPTYTIDEDTKEITIPDFTAITVDGTWELDQILAKFTNCKLTFKSHAEIDIMDISGEYHFTATTYDSESSFTKEFDMTLEATNVAYTAYKVTLDFGEEYSPVVLDATYDGYVLTVDYANAYLNYDKTVYLGTLAGGIPSKTGTFAFKYLSETALSLDAAFRILTDPVDDELTVTSLQYYVSGSALKKVADTDNFAGTYHVVCDEPYVLLTNDEYNYVYPKEFDFTIEKNAYNDKYYVHQFMNGNIYNGTQGYYPCEVEGNSLKIPVGDAVSIETLYMSDDWDVIVGHVLYDGQGTNVNPVVLTVNEDGSCEMGDFFLARKTTIYDTSTWQATSTFEPAVFYGDLTVTKNDGDGIKTVSASQAADKVVVAGGIIYSVGGEVPVKVYNTAGVCVFNGVTSAVSGLSKGLYVVVCNGTAVKVAL